MTRPFSKWATIVRWIWRPAFAACLFVLPTGCIEWQQTVASERPTIANYISAVTTQDGSIKAALAAGTPQTGGAIPVVTAPIPALILLGGTIQVTASAPTPFTKIAVVIPDLDDYWELTLPAATTSAQILMVFGQNIPVPVFQVRMAGALSGAYGAFKASPISIISVGTGDVQVNITWDSRADVDLHVVDPLGEEVYWAHKTAVSGGTLDLDSNAGCGSDGPRAENIFWASGLIAPHGDYVVRVDYWSNCSDVRTNYVVTVNARGKAPQVFTGFFTGNGDGGGKGSGRIITTATY
jgi:hypothetical protein